jgi:putative peptidoglycan lipid II flippase
MLVSLASILINVTAASSMVKVAGLGHAGLALTTSLVALFSSIALFEVLRRRIGGIQGRRLSASFVKIAAASATMGAVCALSSRSIGHWIGLSRMARVIDLAVSVPLGLIVFYAMAKWFRLPEMESARRALLAPVARRFR